MRHRAVVTAVACWAALAASAPRAGALASVVQSSSVVGADGSAQALPRDVALLHEALSAENPFVRGQAAMMLGSKGGMQTIRLLGPLLRDSSQDCLNYTMAGVGSLLKQYNYFDPEQEPVYSSALADIEEALMDIVRQNRDWAVSGLAMFALNKFSRLKPETLAELHAIAAGRENSGFLPALRVLALRGEDVGDLVARAISIGVNRYDYRLAQSLGACQERHVPEIRLLLESENPKTLFLARAALERLGDPETDPGLANLRALKIEEMGQSLNNAARLRLDLSKWLDVDRDRILEDARDARLVLFGEIHVSDGPLRDGQIELLRAFFRDSEHDALGFEPGVESAQSSVIHVARELGMQVFSLEENWEGLRSQGRTWERDNEAANRIHEFLGESPENRMFVIRGEGHVAPGGALAGQLRVHPMIVLSAQVPRFEASEGTPGAIRTSDARVASGEQVYLWAMPEAERKNWKVLMDWMQSQE